MLLGGLDFRPKKEYTRCGAVKKRVTHVTPFFFSLQGFRDLSLSSVTDLSVGDRWSSLVLEGRTLIKK